MLKNWIPREMKAALSRVKSARLQNAEKLKKEKKKQIVKISELRYKSLQVTLAQRALFIFSIHVSEIAFWACLLYTSPSPRDRTRSRMPSSA